MFSSLLNPKLLVLDKRLVSLFVVRKAKSLVFS